MNLTSTPGRAIRARGLLSMVARRVSDQIEFGLAYRSRNVIVRTAAGPLMPCANGSTAGSRGSVDPLTGDRAAFRLAGK
jgi:hypothetical protein